jgi:hypothetical protein
MSKTKNKKQAGHNEFQMSNKKKKKTAIENLLGEIRVWL